MIKLLHCVKTELKKLNRVENLGNVEAAIVFQHQN